MQMLKLMCGVSLTVLAVITIAACGADPPGTEPGSGGSPADDGGGYVHCTSDLCVPAAALDAGECNCVALVCAQDPTCCDATAGSWSAACVEQTGELCGADCSGACAHDRCNTGLALEPTCDPCVAAICDASPYCCDADTGVWDQQCISLSEMFCDEGCTAECAHDLCDDGVALDPTCSNCVAAVCATDPFCCDASMGAWDQFCTAAAGNLCGTGCAQICGDMVCGYGESQLHCPEDCGMTYCGDAMCDADEDMMNCPVDCGGTCGDMICAPPETLQTCVVDCGGFCGDGVCDIVLEDSTVCPADCGGGCGDMVCLGGEDVFTCPADCGFCGDSICVQPAESIIICPSDCIRCGDGICSVASETAANCAFDCGYCGDSICAGNETPYGCHTDCGSCGDAICVTPETSQSCPADCDTVVCGDNECEGLENPHDVPRGLPCAGKHVHTVDSRPHGGSGCTDPQRLHRF